MVTVLCSSTSQRDFGQTASLIKLVHKQIADGRVRSALLRLHYLHGHTCGEGAVVEEMCVRASLLTIAYAEYTTKQSIKCL